MQKLANKIEKTSFGGSKSHKHECEKKSTRGRGSLSLIANLARKNRAAFLLVIQVGCEDAPPFFFFR